MFGLTSKQRNATKMVCYYSELTSSLMSAEIKPKLILVTISVTLWTVMPFWACLSSELVTKYRELTPMLPRTQATHSVESKHFTTTL